MAPAIHPSAIISPGAVIEDGVEIGPFCIVNERVTIKSGVRLYSNVVIDGATEIGEGSFIYPFATIGLPPQDTKYDGRETGVRIGKNNVIREYTTIHRGSIGGDGITVVGDNNFFMAYVHIAHDCRLGNNIIMANCATLGGHAEVGDFAFLGGFAVAHQFTRVGAYAMVGMVSGIFQDIPPYTLASGPRTKLYGLNLVGLRRQGFAPDTLALLKKAYRILFLDGLKIKDAVQKVEDELGDTVEVRNMLEFVRISKRGLCDGR